MIRFLANRYTREEVRVLRVVIEIAYNNITANGYNCATICKECHFYRPCLDLSNFLKRLDEILAIPEVVQK